MASKQSRLTEDDVLDQILNSFIPQEAVFPDTLEELLNNMSDEAVVLLHQAIHKHFGD
jgi:hypothetical protein